MYDAGIQNPIELAMQEIEALYRSDMRDRPWVIGFSGGKDSSAVVQLVYRVLRDRIKPEDRKRHIHVVASDTLVEAPAIANYLDDTLMAMRAGVERDKLPMTVMKVTPRWEDTFFVSLIGKGYPSPNRFFRWCTERLKINPTTAYIEERINQNGSVVILLGARKDESATRAQALENHAIEGSVLRKHVSLPNAYVYTPIADWSTDDVWAWLQMMPAPWDQDPATGLGYAERRNAQTNWRLRMLYKDAAGGECPLVIDRTTPSCGQSRFGCWTCTVVNVDSSMEGFIDSGMTEMEPLLEFRNKLKAYRDDPTKRSPVSRTGRNHLGPFTLEVRQEFLRELLQIQQETGFTLVRPQELDLIQQYWVEDGMDINAAPKIWEEVFGQSNLVSAEKRLMREEAEQLLAETCATHEVDLKLVHQLLHVEESMATKQRRRGLMQAIDAILERDGAQREVPAECSSDD